MSDDVARTLLERYHQIDEVTGALRDALETDEFGRLDALVSRRAELIAEASALLGSRASRFTEPRDAQSSEPVSLAWQKALEAGRRALEADTQLRALMVSHAHQIPAALAELRGGRDALRGYSEGSLPPDSVDRRG